jgi:hypothetical protein
MASESFTMRMPRLPTRVTGTTMSSMVKVESIIQSLWLLMNSLTTKIFLSLAINGHITRVSSKMIQSMERGT